MAKFNASRFTNTKPITGPGERTGERTGPLSQDGNKFFSHCPRCGDKMGHFSSKSRAMDALRDHMNEHSRNDRDNTM